MIDGNGEKLKPKRLKFAETDLRRVKDMRMGNENGEMKEVSR